MTDHSCLPGKFVWFEHASSNPQKAQAFYAEVLGWKAAGFPIGAGTYDMIFAGETPDTMVGGYVQLQGAGERSRWIASVSVRDVDAAVAAADAEGGEVIAAPHDLSGIGRGATIADPAGAELALFARANGDREDPPSIPPGRFMWNELHTTEPDRALAFYEKVVGFSHRSVPSPAGPYHVLSSAGVDRGGITSHLPPGTTPHWLPFVHVTDVDGAVDRAHKVGAKVSIGPKNIMDIGRLAVLEDPTGALLALMRPNPRATH
jgi:predicted enzyme related to lactoylglutathione lyase